jgi:hypothetical protein
MKISFMPTGRSVTRGVATLVVAALLAATLMVTSTRTVGAINCSFGAHAPTTDGLTAYGHSSMDCFSYQTDWLTGLLYEWFGPFELQRNVVTNNTNSSGWIHAYTAYYCNGHGTDDWVEKSQGRDLGGNQSGILSGPINSLTC